MKNKNKLNDISVYIKMGCGYYEKLYDKDQVSKSKIEEYIRCGYLVTEIIPDGDFINCTDKRIKLLNIKKT